MAQTGSARVMWRMVGLTRPFLGVMATAVACGVAGFACATGVPVLAAEAALVAAGRGSLDWGLPAIVAALAVMAVARGVLHYLEQRCNHYLAFKLLAHVRDLVFGALRRLAPARLAGADRGSLVSTVTSDVELLEVFFAHTISPVCIAVLMAALMAGLLGSVHPALAALALASYALVGVAVPLAVARASGGGGQRGRDLAGDLSGFVLDGLRGMAEVIQYGAGAARLEELDRRSRELVGVQRALRERAGAGQAATSALIVSLCGAALALSCALASSGAVGAEGAVLATVALMSSFGPFVALANLGSTLQHTLAAARRVLAILDERPLVEEVGDGASPAFSGIAAEGVSFSYDGDPVLSDVSLEVAPGQVVGITGRSGSGKSTLCRLLMRFWDADEGCVRLSGVDVREVSTRALRATEALVEQDTHLFHDSIRDNLLIARPGATQEELEEACRAASVHDFVASLPHGYDTMVGELGDTLSGGERQRLGLARAFLHDAPLLLLDEPTSNLDALNEGQVLRSIAERRGDRAVVVVSHRPSTMGIADVTYAMDAGRVS